MNLFGRKKAQPQPAIQQSSAVATNTAVDTIKALRDNYETLEKRELHITKKVEACLIEAKQKAAKKDKKGALFALKRKKMFESEVMKLQGARITLDQQIMALESAAVNITTLKAMSSGAAAMKQLRGNIDADTVEDMLDSLQEEKDIHDQIADVISRPGTEMFDDEELLSELAELEELEADELGSAFTAQTSSEPIIMPTAPTSVFSLPAVPTAPLKPASVPVESEEERALRELQASMLA